MENLDHVIEQMHRVADHNGIPLVMTPRTCRCGVPYCGFGYLFKKDGGPILQAQYDPNAIKPQEMFWAFAHEMGHAAQDKRNAHYHHMAQELDAWNYAEALAKLSPWPPTEKFYAMRQYALSTHWQAELLGRAS